MRKKKLWLFFWSMILILAVALEVIIIENESLKWPKKVVVENYGLELKYPRIYEDIEKEENVVQQISSKITTTVEEIELDTNGVTVNLVEELIHAKSEMSGITILVEGLKTEKTTKTTEEICKDFITMFKVFNQEQKIIFYDYEIVNIDGVEAGKTEIYVEGENAGVYPGMISYLISLDDREITISFTGTKRLFETNKSEINKIVESIKLEK